MTPAQLPLTRDLVLVGGGHTHALVLRRWAMQPLPGVRVTVINPDPTAPYSGMLPGFIAGHYAHAELMIDLVRLARFAGARLILDRAVGLDPGARLVHLSGRPPVAYDLASIDIGIGTGLPDLPGMAAHGVPAKPMALYARRWEAFLQAAQAGQLAARVAVIGAGVAGMELALAMAHRMRALGLADASVAVIERAAAPLPLIGDGARAALLAHADRLGVVLHLGQAPVRIGPDAVELADGRLIPSSLTVPVAGARPQGWLAETGLTVHEGFVVVGETLQSSDPAVFAVGDCAHMAYAPRPKAGVYAVRQAPVLAHNLRVALSGGRMRHYRPQADYLKLVSTGGRRAVADKWGLRLDAPLLWRWKDRIDRRFMRMFDELPPMPLPALPPTVAHGVRAEVLGTPPLCGGCGAKVAGGALQAGLAGLAPPRRPDVLTGAGDDAAVLTHGAGVQVISTDSLRAFTEDPWLMGRVAALHALGDIWAMGAQPQVAVAQIGLPRASQALQGRMLQEVLTGASEVLVQAGADLVGGHTVQGEGLTVGFTLTGLAPHPLRKAGARPGDRLILTRALGVGTLLAAEMAHRAMPPGEPMLGDLVARCLAQMQRPGAGAARILADGAQALTDVTGFGLAGHLWEMLVASGQAARLDLAALPVLPGALALAGAGVRPHLAAANRAAVPCNLPDTALGWLLSDPQTCGGFLAAVPPETAPAMLAALQAVGETDAAVIGTILPGPPGLEWTDG